MPQFSSGFFERVIGIVGGPFVLTDQASLESYGADALKQIHPADLVVLPGSTRDVSLVAALCDEHRVGAYAVVGALSLYLDFINLFFFLLRFTGNRRN